LPASGNACDKRWQILSFSLATVSAIASLVVGWLLSGWQNFALMPLGGKNAGCIAGVSLFLKHQLYFTGGIAPPTLPTFVATRTSAASFCAEN
jgi:hypothetical protein